MCEKRGGIEQMEKSGASVNLAAWRFVSSDRRCVWGGGAEAGWRVRWLASLSVCGMLAAGGATEQSDGAGRRRCFQVRCSCCEP